MFYKRFKKKKNQNNTNKHTHTHTHTQNKNQNAQVYRGSAIGLDADVAFLLLIRQPSNVSQRRPVSVKGTHSKICYLGFALYFSSHTKDMNTCHLQNNNNNSTLHTHTHPHTYTPTHTKLIAVRTRQTIILKHPTKNNNKDRFLKKKAVHHDKTNKHTNTKWRQWRWQSWWPWAVPLQSTKIQKKTIN